MDYIITDEVASPLSLDTLYSEKFAYMPNTFFIGDHAHMFPHLNERVVLDTAAGGAADSVLLVNATNLQPLLETADAVKVRKGWEGGGGLKTGGECRRKTGKRCTHLILNLS